MTKRRLILFLVVELFLALEISVLVLNGQSDRGIITGTVTDESGAAIVGVSLTVTNTGTSVSFKTTTGSNGSYTIALLPVGTYLVNVEQPGFKKFVKNGIVVQVGQTAPLDIVMELGGVNETVEVHADASTLLPNTSDLGTVITRQQFQDLPLLGQGETRNPTFFMTLVPGVTGRGTAYGGGGTFDSRSLSTTVSGSQSGSLELHLDGASLNSAAEFSGDPRNVGFPPDAVEEFKMTTLNAPAEYGRTGGGIASFTLKSGTNQLHGSLYEYFRNDALDARGFFAAKTPTNRQNEFGATAGGPIRKNKTFFFGWYNGFRLNRGNSNTLETIPTEAMKQGDLSAYLGDRIGTDALGRPVLQGAVYDPATTRQVTAGQVDRDTGLTATSDATIRDPFPRNIISPNRFDTVSKSILPLFPTATLPGLTRNFASQAADVKSVNQWGTKLDHSLASNHKVFGSFVWSTLNTPGAAPFPGVIGGAIPGTDAVRIFRLSEDSLLRPNLINHATFGFNRWRYGTNATPDLLGWPGKIGLRGVNPDGVFPHFNINGQSATYGANDGIGYGAQNNFNVSEGLNWIRGKHTIKFGFEYLKSQSNDVGSFLDTGFFVFDYKETALPGFPAGLTGTGQGMASFLLGWADQGEVRVYASGSYERSAYYAGYAQDDFKLTPKLTLNVGLRYDVFRPTVDKWNHLAWVDMQLPNPALGGFPGTMVFATPDRRTGVDQFNKAFAPRFGLGYSLDNKTVLRSGYGLLWAPGGYIRSSRGLYIQGYNQTNFWNSRDGGLTPAFIFQEGWPAQRWQVPPYIDPTTGFKSGVHILDRSDAHPPYLQNWVLNIQRQLPGKILLDVAYVGNKGTRLQSRLIPTNHIDPRHLPLGDMLHRDISDPVVQALSVVQSFPVDPATGHHVPFVGFETYLAGATTLGQALRPTPQYLEESNSQNRRFYEGTGKSTYHALQAKIDKRFSRGLSFLVAYTWSKTLTDAESQFSEFSGFTEDPYNRKAEKSISINDYPHNLVINFSYELPFGPGKRFATAGGVTGRIVGGWKIAGIQQYQSGGPSIINTNTTLWPYAGVNGFMARPNVVPGVEQKSAALLSGDFDPNRDSMFNPKAWENPAPFTFGNGPRTYGGLRRFAYLNEDISLIKRTNVNDRASVEFRADFINVFNRTVFGLGTGGDQYGTSLNTLINSQSNYPREIQFGLKINY